MKWNLLRSLMAVAILPILVISCGKSDSPSPSSKTVKYEISGNYTGQFRVVYISQMGNQSETITQLPWTKEVTFTNLPASAGLGSNAITGKPGVPGQTATAKIYVGTQVVQSTSQTANGDGYIFSLPTLAYAVQ